MTQNENPITLEKLSLLFEHLREASWVHQNPHELRGGSRWTGAIMACHAVAKFIHDSGWSPELAAPLMEIKEGFKDLERDKIPPIFSLNPEPLKRDRSLHRSFHHDWAAAILEIAIEGGEGEWLAAKRIARSVCKWTALRSQEITGTTIVNWRKTIKGGSREERKRFEALRDTLHADPAAKDVIKKVLAEGPPGLQKS